ncbi:hypothetical protein PoB_006111400 [Plakobranchus ocellatus]|uniref:Uncharacterized protein n=1 Tax=Plakobranchus ocellatus TaxID=259542 RepID=A0AAV4CRU3_9GAST|nr:hypothetical protein PoB_006111400 [Plakobranchus ocellatus]
MQWSVNLPTEKKSEAAKQMCLFEDATKEGTVYKGIINEVRRNLPTDVQLGVQGPCSFQGKFTTALTLHSRCIILPTQSNQVPFSARLQGSVACLV